MEKNKRNLLVKYKYRNKYTSCMNHSLDLFPLLQEYHIQKNLPACLPYVQEGVLVDPAQGPLKEGLDENKLYPGLLIVANGDKLPGDLVSDKIVLDNLEEIIYNPQPISTADSFFDYLEKQEGDGAHVFNGFKKEMTRVYQLNNNPESLSVEDRAKWLSRIPSNFVFTDGTPTFRKHIGTRTFLADILPLAYKNVDTFQIKQTAYTSLGLGKVTHFNRQGLVEEFFFNYAPNHHGNFLAPVQKIIGVYRRYSPQDDRPLCVEEKVYPSPSCPKRTSSLLLVSAV